MSVTTILAERLVAYEKHIRELEEELAETKQLYKAGCDQWNPVYKTVLDRNRELEEELAVTGERLDQATAILRDLIGNWDDWTIERHRPRPFSPPISATRAWLKALEGE